MLTAPPGVLGGADLVAVEQLQLCDGVPVDIHSRHESGAVANAQRVRGEGGAAVVLHVSQQAV